MLGNKKRFINFLVFAGKKTPIPENPISNNITQVDTITNKYDTDTNIWGYIAQLKPKIENNISYTINVNFEGLSTDYFVAIGVSEKKYNEEFLSTVPYSQVEAKYNDALNNGYYFVYTGTSTSIYNKGNLDVGLPDFKLFRFGDQCIFEFNKITSTLNLGSVPDVLATYTGIDITNLYLTLIFIKKNSGTLPIYLSITEASQTQTSYNPLNNTAIFTQNPQNYSYVFCFPQQISRSSGKMYNINISNPNNLITLFLALGVVSTYSNSNFVNETLFNAYLSTTLNINSNTITNGLFRPGGVCRVSFFDNDVQFTFNNVTTTFTCFPTNYICFVVRSFGTLNPFSVQMTEYIPDPSDFKETLDSLTSFYGDAGNNIWGYSAKLSPLITSDVQYYVSVNFSPTRPLTDYYLAIGISEEEISNVYTTNSHDLVDLDTEFTTILSKGFYFVPNGSGVDLYNKGVYVNTTPFTLFNPGGHSFFTLSNTLQNIDLGYSYGSIGNFSITNTNDLHLTLVYIKKSVSFVADDIYLSISTTPQDPFIVDYQTGITTLIPHPQNYSYTLNDPRPILNNSERFYYITLTNPNNDLSNETFYIGVTDVAGAITFVSVSEFDTYIQSKRTVNSTMNLQTVDGAFHPGGTDCISMHYINDKVEIRTASTVTLLDAYPINYFIIGVKTNGIPISPMQAFIREVLPTPQDYISALDPLTNIYSQVEADKWGYITNITPQITSDTIKYININFNYDVLLENFYIGFGLTEEKLDQVYRNIEFDLNAINAEYTNILSKGYFIVQEGDNVVSYNKGVLDTTDSSRRLFTVGGEVKVDIYNSLANVQFNSSSLTTSSFIVSNNSNLYLTMFMIRKTGATSQPLYLSVSDVSQLNPSIVSTGGDSILAYSTHSQNYSFIHKAPNSIPKPLSGEVTYFLNFYNNGNNLTDETIYLGIDSRPDNISLINPLVLDSIISGKFLSPTGPAQTSENFYYPGGNYLTLRITNTTTIIENSNGTIFFTSTTFDNNYIFVGLKSQGTPITLFTLSVVEYSADPLDDLFVNTLYTFQIKLGETGRSRRCFPIPQGSEMTITLSGIGSSINSIYFGVADSAYYDNLSSAYRKGIGLFNQINTSTMAVSGDELNYVNTLLLPNTMTQGSLSFYLNNSTNSVYLSTSKTSGDSSVSAKTINVTGNRFLFIAISSGFPAQLNTFSDYKINFTVSNYSQGLTVPPYINYYNTSNQAIQTTTIPTAVGGTYKVFNLLNGVGDFTYDSRNINSMIVELNHTVNLSNNTMFLGIVSSDFSSTIFNSEANLTNALVGNSFSGFAKTNNTLVSFTNGTPTNRSSEELSSTSHHIFFGLYGTDLYYGITGNNAPFNPGLVSRSINSVIRTSNYYLVLAIATDTSGYSGFNVPVKTSFIDFIPPVTFSLTPTNVSSLTPDTIYKCFINDNQLAIGKSFFNLPFVFEFDIEITYITPDITNLSFNFTNTATVDTNSYNINSDGIGEGTITEVVTNSFRYPLPGSWLKGNKSFYHARNTAQATFAKTKTSTNGDGEFSKTVFTQGSNRKLFVSINGATTLSSGYERRIEFKVKNYSTTAFPTPIDIDTFTSESTPLLVSTTIPAVVTTNNFKAYKIGVGEEFGNYTYNSSYYNAGEIIYTPTNFDYLNGFKHAWIGFVPGNGDNFVNGTYNSINSIRSALTSGTFYGVERFNDTATTQVHYYNGNSYFLTGKDEIHGSSSAGRSLIFRFYSGNLYLGHSSGGGVNYLLKLKENMNESVPYTLVVALAWSTAYGAITVQVNKQTGFSYPVTENITYGQPDNTVFTNNGFYKVNQPVGTTLHSSTLFTVPDNCEFELKFIKFLSSHTIRLGFSDVQFSGSTLFYKRGALACVGGGTTTDYNYKDAGKALTDQLSTDPIFTAPNTLYIRISNGTVYYSNSKNSVCDGILYEQVLMKSYNERIFWINTNSASNSDGRTQRVEFKIQNFSSLNVLPIADWNYFTSGMGDTHLTLGTLPGIPSSVAFGLKTVGPSNIFGDYTADSSLINAGWINHTSNNQGSLSSKRYIGFVKGDGSSINSGTYNNTTDIQNALLANSFMGLIETNQQRFILKDVNGALTTSSVRIGDLPTSGNNSFIFLFYGNDLYLGYYDSPTNYCLVKVRDTLTRSDKYTFVWGYELDNYYYLASTYYLKKFYGEFIPIEPAQIFIPDLTTLVVGQTYKLVIDNGQTIASKSCFPITDQNCEFNIEFPYISPNITKIRINFNTAPIVVSSGLYNGRICIDDQINNPNTRFGGNLTPAFTNDGSAFYNCTGKWIFNNRSIYMNFSSNFHKFSISKSADLLGETVLNTNSSLDTEPKYLIISIESSSVSNGFNERIDFKITNYNIITPYSDGTLYNIDSFSDTIPVTGWSAMDKFVIYKGVSNAYGDYTFDHTLANMRQLAQSPSFGGVTTTRQIWIGFVPNDGVAISNGVYNSILDMQNAMAANNFMGMHWDGTPSTKWVIGSNEFSSNGSFITSVGCLFYNTNFYMGVGSLFYKLRGDLDRTSKYTLIYGFATINNTLTTTNCTSSLSLTYKFNPADTWSYLPDNTLPIVNQEYTITALNNVYMRREKLFPTNGLFEMEIEITYIDPSINGIAFSIAASGTNLNFNAPEIVVNSGYFALIGGQSNNMIISNSSNRTIGTANWLFTDKTLFITTSNELGGNPSTRQILFGKSRNSPSGPGNITKIISQESTLSSSNLIIAFSRSTNVGNADLKFRLISYSTRTMPTNWNLYSNFGGNQILSTPDILTTTSNQMKTMTVGTVNGFGDYSFGGLGSRSLINAFLYTKNQFFSSSVRYFGLIKGSGSGLVSTTYTSETTYKSALASNGFIGFRKNMLAIGSGIIINNGVESSIGLREENASITPFGFWIYGKKMFLGTRGDSFGLAGTAIQIADNIDRSATYTLIYGLASAATAQGDLIIYEAVNNFLPENDYLRSAQFSTYNVGSVYRNMIPEGRLANYHSFFNSYQWGTPGYISGWSFTKISSTNVNGAYIGISDQTIEFQETISLIELRILWGDTSSKLINYTFEGTKNFSLFGSSYDKLNFEMQYPETNHTYIVVKHRSLNGAQSNMLIARYTPNSSTKFLTGATSLTPSVDPNLNNWAYAAEFTDLNGTGPSPSINFTNTQGTYINNGTLSASPISYFAMILGTVNEFGFFDNSYGKRNSAYIEITSYFSWTLYDNITPNNLRVYVGLVHNGTNITMNSYNNTTELEAALTSNGFFGMSRQGPLDTDFYLWDDYGKTQIESSMFALFDNYTSKVWFGMSHFNNGIWIGDGYNGGTNVKDVNVAYRLRGSIIPLDKTLIVAVARPYDNTNTMPVTLSCQLLSSSIKFRSGLFN